MQWLLSRWQASRLRTSLVWLTPELAQGPAFGGRLADGVAALGVRSVLDLRETHPYDLDALHRAGLRYRHLPMDEYAPPTVDGLSEGVEWSAAEIAAGRPVLVQCRLGRSRSACMVAAILVGQGHSLPSALSALRAVRPDAILNERQLARLAEFAELARSG